MLNVKKLKYNISSTAQTQFRDVDYGEEDTLKQNK